MLPKAQDWDGLGTINIEGLLRQQDTLRPVIAMTRGAFVQAIVPRQEDQPR